MMKYLALFFILSDPILVARSKDEGYDSSGDTLLLTIIGEPNGQFLVSNDGDIAHALLGKIDAAQKSSNELAQHVAALLKDGYILNQRSASQSLIKSLIK